MFNKLDKMISDLGKNVESFSKEELLGKKGVIHLKGLNILTTIKEVNFEEDYFITSYNKNFRFDLSNGKLLYTYNGDKFIVILDEDFELVKNEYDKVKKFKQTLKEINYRLNTPEEFILTQEQLDEVLKILKTD